MPEMKHAIIAWERTPTNVALARAADWLLLNPVRALKVLRSGDVALARLDVRQTLDGIEVGMEALGELSARGVSILNDPSVLLSTHDKLLTARLLGGAGIPHPTTHLATAVSPTREWTGPVVVKPRFGSWGNHVVRCESAEELCSHLESIAGYRWFQSGGAIVQELVPPSGFDLRLVVARGRVVGAVNRVCADGEWRTNIALGAQRVPATPSAGAVRLALGAAAVVNGSFVGVDLLPTEGGGWIVLEINGAVELTDDYSFVGDVFAAAAEALSDPRESVRPRVRSVA
jgi:ribosomal protein S6--L-glutamate ligase